MNYYPFLHQSGSTTSNPTEFEFPAGYRMTYSPAEGFKTWDNYGAPLNIYEMTGSQIELITDTALDGFYSSSGFLADGRSNLIRVGGSNPTGTFDFSTGFSINITPPSLPKTTVGTLAALRAAVSAADAAGVDSWIEIDDHITTDANERFGFGNSSTHPNRLKLSCTGSGKLSSQTIDPFGGGTIDSPLINLFSFWCNELVIQDFVTDQYDGAGGYFKIQDHTGFKLHKSLRNTFDDISNLHDHYPGYTDERPAPGGPSMYGAPYLGNMEQGVQIIQDCTFRNCGGGNNVTGHVIYSAAVMLQVRDCSFVDGGQCIKTADTNDTFANDSVIVGNTASSEGLTTYDPNSESGSFTGAVRNPAFLQIYPPWVDRSYVFGNTISGEWKNVLGGRPLQGTGEIFMDHNTYNVDTSGGFVGNVGPTPPDETFAQWQARGYEANSNYDEFFGGGDP